jgi:peptide/nickel transport system permease protein
VTSGIWWTSIFPGSAIVLVVLGITLVGESLNDLSDPRLRTRRRAAGVTSLADVSVQGGGALDDEIANADELEGRA